MCNLISDYNINPCRNYITILSIRIFRVVKICTLERSVFYYTEAVALTCSIKNVLQKFRKIYRKTPVLESPY